MAFDLDPAAVVAYGVHYTDDEPGAVLPLLLLSPIPPVIKPSSSGRLLIRLTTFGSDASYLEHLATVKRWVTQRVARAERA